MYAKLGRHGNGLIVKQTGKKIEDLGEISKRHHWVVTLTGDIFLVFSKQT